MFIANGISEQQCRADVIRTREYEVILITNRHTHITQAVLNNTLLESLYVYSYITNYHPLPGNARTIVPHTYTVHEYVTSAWARCEFKNKRKSPTNHCLCLLYARDNFSAQRNIVMYNTVVYILYYLNIYTNTCMDMRHCRFMHAQTL